MALVPSGPPSATNSSAATELPSFTSPFSSRTRELLRRLELDITLRLDGLLQGNHRGLVPGHGSDLGETRAYAPGDDVRRIDWNVTARLSDTYIRQTIAERELEAWLVVDRSARIDFGTASCEKRDLVLAAAAAVGFLTNADGNRIGAVLANSVGPPTTLQARSSRRHLMHLLHTIADSPRLESSGPTDLASLLRHTGAVARRRGLVVVISDFWVDNGWLDSIRVLATRHQVLAVEVVDQRELALPNVGLLPVVDPATGNLREIATHKANVRRAYADAATARRDALATSLRSARVEHLALQTDRPWLEDLVSFIAQRRSRLIGSGGGRR
ncbi:MAG: DUF58 domain-containing protein [Actinomycetota bacterium]|nr:DUF58 domain-containing protein [Actinomycetota bacterium]